jgi:hypothetical protein
MAMVRDGKVPCACTVVRVGIRPQLAPPGNLAAPNFAGFDRYVDHAARERDGVTTES